VTSATFCGGTFKKPVALQRGGEVLHFHLAEHAFNGGELLRCNRYGAATAVAFFFTVAAVAFFFLGCAAAARSEQSDEHEQTDAMQVARDGALDELRFHGRDWLKALAGHGGGGR
jgi:hypothetical protein